MFWFRRQGKHRYRIEGIRLHLFHSIPKPNYLWCCYQTSFGNFWTISRQLFLSIAGFAPNEETKATLTRIGNDKQEFASTITRRKFNIADALLFASKGKAWVDVPFEFIIENVQHLTPRYYSISSSSLSENN